MKFKIVTTQSSLNEALDDQGFRLLYMNLFYFLSKELGVKIQPAAEPRVMESGGSLMVTFKTLNFAKNATPSCFDQLLISGQSVYEDGWKQIDLTIHGKIGDQEFASDLMKLKVLPKQKFERIK